MYVVPVAAFLDEATETAITRSFRGRHDAGDLQPRIDKVDRRQRRRVRCALRV